MSSKPPSERTPLLVSPAGTKPARRRSPSPTNNRSSSHPPSPTTNSRPHLSAHRDEEGVLHLTEDDIAIEGLVLVLLEELVERGYSVPPGLGQRPPDMPYDEAQLEAALFRTVFTLPRHEKVLDEFLPDLHQVRLTVNGDAARRASGPLPSGATSPPLSGPSTRPMTPASTSQGINGGYNFFRHDSDNSALSSIDPAVISSPSALFLCALLALLISLQDEGAGSSVQETDRGVDGELRMFKAKRQLGERLYAVVGGLLDSYLLSGDVRNEEGDDALVTLLFKDFALNYDSTDRATCALDLLLNLSSYPLVEAEELVSHPVVLASTEYVWRNGLLPAPARGQSETLSWTQSFTKLDRFSVPRILHMQTYILSAIHAAITVYILMFSAYTHFYSLNPLAPDAPMPIGTPERHHPIKTWSVGSALVWWFWVAGAFGWAGEVGRAWHHRGPHPVLPLSPSTLLPLIYHSLVLCSVAIRLVLGFFKTPPAVLLAISLSLLAWSVPFLAASRVLPQNMPAFGAPTHMRWEKIRDGRKKRDVGYRAPPKSVPVSHRALRAIEQHLGGLVQFSSYFAVFGALLLWSLAGELDYPSSTAGAFVLEAFTAPHTFLVAREEGIAAAAAAVAGKKGRTLTPLEARTSLAFTLLLGVVLAYFSGGRPSVSGKETTARSTGAHRGLTDLDGWDRHGREVAFRARRERLAVTRYYTYVPPKADQYHHDKESGEDGPEAYGAVGVPSAFSTPPLPSPLNLVVPVVVAGAWVERHWRVGPRGGGGAGRGRWLQERGRLWVWRVGMGAFGVLGVGAKVVRKVRGRE